MRDLNVWSQFVTRLRELRRAAKRPDGGPMRQADLARLIGVSNKLVSAWERGERSPNIQQLIAVAAALGATLAEFFAEFEVVAGALPSSFSAILDGCTCPVGANNQGRGFTTDGITYVVRVDCPMHGFSTARRAA